MISLQNIHKSFKKFNVIKDLSLEIAKGEIVSLIGPSGCGKTTTIKMINGLEKPTEGKVLIDGKDISDLDLIQLRRGMGYIIQQTGLFPHMTIEENIGIIPKLEGKDKDEIRKKVYSLMEMIGLDADDYLWRYPAQLSGGQLQRVGVARAFAMDPEIILMDEPFSALDPVTREQLQNELLEIQSKMKKTIVFVTHDMREAIKISDKICILNNGKIAQYDTPENILKKPADEFVTNFVGENRIWSSPEFIRVADIMIKKPVWVHPNYTIFRSMELMRQKKVDTVFVVDDKDILLGYVKARDIQNIEDRDQLISDYMKMPAITSNPKENLLSLLEKVENNKQTTIPVLEETGKLAGLVTKSSLVTTLSTQYIGIKGGVIND